MQYFCINIDLVSKIARVIFFGLHKDTEKAPKRAYLEERMATSLIETYKINYSGHPRYEISDMEVVFCDCILKGMTNLDSVFEAGFYPKDKKDDTVYRNRAKAKATALLRKRCVREYIRKNRRTIYLDNDCCDRRALKVHMYEIAMGNVTQKVMRDGEEEQVPPSFRDQIAAAAMFNKMDNEDRMAGINSIDVMPASVTEEIDSKVSKFISRFNCREIAENHSIEKLEKKGVVEAEYDDVKDAVDGFLEKEASIG